MERTAVIRLPRDGMFYRRSDITAAVESRVNINNIAAFILTIIMRFGYSISESIQGEWIVVIFIVAGFIYLIATIISPLSVNWKTTCVGRLFFFTDTASKIKFVGARGMCEVKDQPASVESLRRATRQLCMQRVPMCVPNYHIYWGKKVSRSSGRCMRLTKSFDWRATLAWRRYLPTNSRWVAQIPLAQLCESSVELREWSVLRELS